MKFEITSGEITAHNNEGSWAVEVYPERNVVPEFHKLWAGFGDMSLAEFEQEYGVSWDGRNLVGPGVTSVFSEYTVNNGELDLFAKNVTGWIIETVDEDGYDETVLALIVDLSDTSYGSPLMRQRVWVETRVRPSRASDEVYEMYSDFVPSYSGSLTFSDGSTLVLHASQSFDVYDWEIAEAYGNQAWMFYDYFAEVGDDVERDDVVSEILRTGTFVFTR